MKKKLFSKNKSEDLDTESTENTSGISESEESSESDLVLDEIDRSIEENESGKKKIRKKSRAQRKKEKTYKDQIVRIAEVEKMMEKYGDDIDPETIVSMYLPRRRWKRFGAALLRMDKLSLILMGALLLIAVLFIAAFMQEKMGNFTINLNRLELYRKGVSIADNQNFEKATARLTANTIADATNISIEDLPDNLDDVSGSHNGKNYMAYTYYVRNAGKEDLGYVAKITLDSCSKGAEDAVRVAVWKNGERVVYAEPAADGGTEDGCTNFESKDVVCSYEESNFLVGNVDKYTIVIWMEGDDPECVDQIIGGSVEFSMNIEADYDDETSLLWKFVKDIKDTLTGDKPIDAAGNAAPNNSYYTDREITWENRRNK